jgi:NAD(P)H-dependent FMN reductase
MKIKVILGSTRQNRFGEQPAQWIYKELQKRKGITAELIDLRDWPLPFFDEPVSPLYNNGVYVNELAPLWAKKIGEADGYIMVTPEYNHGYSAVLKNAIDYLYKEWNNKPVAFVGYGSVGGARSIEQLRNVAVELQMTPVRQAVHIVEQWNHLDEKGNFISEPFTKTANLMLDQLTWWTKALKAARENN